jgi:aspartate/tyrosine/aromatic aminotransferase
MFEGIQAAPPDAIFGLKEAYREDPNPDKINLTVGVYQDETGATPVFDTVKLAEARLLEEETSKSYLSIDGSPEYAKAVQALVLGTDHEVVTSGRAATAQTPGGTGALRVAGDLIRRVRGDARIWLSEPTWANHPQIYGAAGLAVERYPYYDAETNGLAIDALLTALAEIPSGDVVLLHGSCHNPTGVDPTPEQWAAISDVVATRGLFPLVDFAYQGLGDGLREDTAGLLALCKPETEMMIASSFSKNFGVYNERVGALTVVTPSAEDAAATLSHTKKVIRANYSNPPAHGARVVTTVLNDDKLRPRWEGEVQAMCDRINQMRRGLVEALAKAGVKRDVSFIARQRGMFSYSGLTKAQAQALREEHSVYILDSGRINVAGLNEGNLAAVAQAIAAVLGE